MEGMFYYVSTNQQRNPCVVSLDKGQSYDSRAVFRGESVPSVPLKFHHTMGRQPKDVLKATDGITRIVSDRFLGILRENGTTGWSTFPVVIYDKKGNDVPGYSGFSVVGRSGPLDDTKQRVEIRVSPFNPDYQYRLGIGLSFDRASWDGTDIFTPGGGIIFVVNKVKTLLENIIKEFEFCDIQEFEQDLGPA